PLNTLLPTHQTQTLIQPPLIQIPPLPYITPTTLHDAFLILHQPQNTTHPQIKIFLTPLPFPSKILLTPHQTQIHLPKRLKTAFKEPLKKLTPLTAITIIKMDQTHLLTHPLLTKI
ncbi:PhoH family protein, partial [Staphylococcus epidermidis]|uniref:PhoH family protein n=1 Tax=Staphylococcus epidermidis TaxID=1282 RepID=UPI0011A574DE